MPNAIAIGGNQGDLLFTMLGIARFDFGSVSVRLSRAQGSKASKWGSTTSSMHRSIVSKRKIHTSAAMKSQSGESISISPETQAMLRDIKSGSRRALSKAITMGMHQIQASNLRK